GRRPGRATRRSRGDLLPVQPRDLRRAPTRHRRRGPRTVARRRARATPRGLRVGRGSGGRPARRSLRHRAPRGGLMIHARALPRPRSRARGALAIVVVLGSLAACGIPGDEGPRAIDQEQIPDQGAAVDGSPGDGRTALADLYFNDGTRDRLVVVQRKVPAGGSASAPTPSTVLENLLLGTQEGDDPVGDTDLDNVVTLIPPQTQL